MHRVLCFIENLGSGGAERQLTGLAVMLHEKGYSVEVCYYVRNDFYLSYLQENGVRGFLLAKANNPKKRFFCLQKHIRDVKPDTVISYSTSPSMIACLLKMFGAKFNLIVSERNTTQYLDFSVRMRFFLYRWANHIVPNSHSQGNFIDRYFPHLANKVKVITNFVNTEKFSPSNLTISEHEETRMICVGRLMPQKNITRFIEAIGLVVKNGHKIQVDWFGQDLNDEYSEKCHAAIRNHHLEDIFVFHAPSSNIQNEYLHANVFCLPSLYEGFPNVLCEAMCCGLPVICSRVCDNPKIVQEGVNGLLFNPFDINNIKCTIEKYLDFPIEQKVSFGNQSRKRSLDLFSKDQFVQNYLDII